MTKIFFKAILLIGALSGTVIFSSAQQPPKKNIHRKMDFFLQGNISLDSLKEFIHINSKTRFSFNSSKVNGAKEIFFPARWYSLKGLLEHVSKTTSLYYAVYDGYIVMTDHPIAPKKIAWQNNEPTLPVEKQPRSPKNIHNKGKDDEAAHNKVGLLPANTNHSAWKTTNVIFSQVERSGTEKYGYHPIGGWAKDSLHVIYDKSVLTSPKKNNAKENIRQGKNKRENPFSLNLHYGVDWNANIPFHGVRDYLVGPGNKSQPYYLLIPGLWISAPLTAKSGLVAHLKFAQQYYPANPAIKDTAGVFPVVDSLSVARIKWIVTKTFGTEASISYAYQLDPHFSIAAGILFYWQSSALVHAQTTLESTGRTLGDSAFVARKNSSQWQNIKPSIFAGRMEFSYTFNKISAGGLVLLPFSAVAGSDNRLLKGINVQLFLRYRLH